MRSKYFVFIGKFALSASPQFKISRYVILIAIARLWNNILKPKKPSKVKFMFQHFAGIFLDEQQKQI